MNELKSSLGFKPLKNLFLIFIFLTSFVSASQVCQVYDDFSSGTFDTSKWEIRQDPSGQSLPDDYGVDIDLENFHTSQDTVVGDRRVYLVPNRTFTTGDILEYDFNVVSHEGNYMQIDYIGNSQVGIMGYINGVQGYDQLGVSHIKIELQKDNLHLERTSPSGITLVDNLPLAQTDNKIYIGALAGHNGKMHIDFDNFKICREEVEPVCEDKIIELESKIDDLNEEIISLKLFVDKIEKYLWFLKSSIKKDLLCETLKETGEKKIEKYGVKCEINELKRKTCFCKKV